MRIRAGENLNPQRQRHRAAHFGANNRHCCDNLRSDTSLQIWTVVSVFDHEAVEACFLVNASFVNCDRRDLCDAVLACRSARQRLQVHHADERAVHAEQGFYDARLVQDYHLLNFAISNPQITQITREQLNLPFEICVICVICGIHFTMMFLAESIQINCISRGFERVNGQTRKSA